jgi:tetratricopeptide (TPR) repeat protein
MFFALILAAITFAHGVHAEAVKAWEGTLELETYPWLDDPNPVFEPYEGSIYYPYTRQDHLLKTKELRTYRALFLENEYLKITCLPELGGRIHSVWDKTTNHEVFHTPGIIKPALIAMRGAWIAGGIEWNVGPQGHTVTIVSPVDATIVNSEDGSATLVIGNTEKMFRTRWTVRVTLHPGKAYLDESIRMFNPTDGTHTYYFWNNTAFPNLEGTRFIFPMSLGSNHNGDEFFSWPLHEGKDMTYLKNYPTMSSVFGYQCDQDFFGAYDVDLDRGIVSHANHHSVQGKKAWTWGKDDFGVRSQMALSDSGPVDSPYIEVQSGPLLTQADYGFLRPLQEVAWREYWYSVHGLGDGFEFANRDLAVNATRKDNTLELRMMATGEFSQALCVVSQDGHVLVKAGLDLSPAKAATLTVSEVSTGPVNVEVFDAKGKSLLAYATPLAIKPVSPPDLAGEAAWRKTLPLPTQAFMDAELLNRENKPEAAKAKYEEVIANSPGHVPALTALATLLLERGDYEGAIARCREAIRVEEENSDAWYVLGAAQLASGDFQGAIDAGHAVARGLANRAAGYSLAGRGHMRLGQIDKAIALFGQAHALAPDNAQIRDWLLAARLKNGEDISGAVKGVIASEDPTDLVLYALLALAGRSAEDPVFKYFREGVGEKEFTIIECATFFMNLGMYAEAGVVLDSARNDARFDGYGPLPRYYLAWCAAQSGNVDAAKATVEEAIAMPHTFAFPSRPETRAVLAYAASVAQDDPNVLTLQGNLEAGLYNTAKAVEYWEKAAARPGVSSVPLRLLALDTWKVKKDLDRAEIHFRKAIAVNSEDQLNYRDLALVLADQKRTAEAIGLLEGLPKELPARFDIVLWLAEAYVGEKRYDDSLALLKGAKFTNFEGSTRPHDVFEAALTGRGKGYFAAGDYEKALTDFSEALTYPEFLEVGARYVLTDAELRYWQGQSFAKLGRLDEAKEAWKVGASQVSKDTPPMTYINVDDVQDLHVKKCATALEVMGGD